MEERSKQGQTNNKAKQHSTPTCTALLCCLYGLIACFFLPSFSSIINMYIHVCVVRPRQLLHDMLLTKPSRIPQDFTHTSSSLTAKNSRHAGLPGSTTTSSSSSSGGDGGGRGGGGRGCAGRTSLLLLEQCHVCGREPANLSLLAAALELSVPPPRGSLLLGHLREGGREGEREGLLVLGFFGIRTHATPQYLDVLSRCQIELVIFPSLVLLRHPGNQRLRVCCHGNIRSYTTERDGGRWRNGGRRGTSVLGRRGRVWLDVVGGKGSGFSIE